MLPEAPDESVSIQLIYLWSFLSSPNAQESHFLPDPGNNEKAVSGRGGGAAARQKQSLKQAVLVGDTGSAWHHGHGRNEACGVPAPRLSDSSWVRSAAGS